MIHNCFCLEREWVHTLSMLAGFRRIIEACAIRVKTVRRARWEYRSCGGKSSPRKALLNIVPTISFITIERAWERWVRKRKTLRQESNLKYHRKKEKKKQKRSCWSLHLDFCTIVIYGFDNEIKTLHEVWFIWITFILVLPCKTNVPLFLSSSVQRPETEQLTCLKEKNSLTYI